MSDESYLSLVAFLRAGMPALIEQQRQFNERLTLLRMFEITPEQRLESRWRASRWRRIESRWRASRWRSCRPPRSVVGAVVVENEEGFDNPHLTLELPDGRTVRVWYCDEGDEWEERTDG